MKDVGRAMVGASPRRTLPAPVAALVVAVFGLVAVLLLELVPRSGSSAGTASAGRTMA